MRATGSGPFLDAFIYQRGVSFRVAGFVSDSEIPYERVCVEGWRSVRGTTFTLMRRYTIYGRIASWKRRAR